MTRLSVIIPGYNTPEKWWCRCLYSVRKACGPDDEIICVDDGSAKHPDILDQFAADDPRVKPLFLEKNIGQAAARNKGLDLAEGEFVVFVDSDDRLEPYAFKKILKYGENSSRDITVFGCRTIWPDDKLYKINVPSETKDIGVLGVDGLGMLINLCLFDVVCCKLYRRVFLEKHRIRFPENICPGEDTMFALSCLMHNATWAAIPEIGYIYYRIDGTTLSSYKPNLVQTLAYWKMKWDEYLVSVGKGYSGWWPTKYYSDTWVARQQWDNIWMRNSPWSICERWRYLIRHKELCRPCAIFVFLKKALYSFLRANFYIKPVRRFHMKHVWRDIKEYK